jgi:hypothetical protein
MLASAEYRLRYLQKGHFAGRFAALGGAQLSATARRMLTKMLTNWSELDVLHGIR